MKILQIIQKTQLRGAEIFACQLSELLVKNGVQVDVVYLFDNELTMPFSLNFIRLGATKAKRFWDFGAYKRLASIIKAGQYDIVQANAGDTLKYAALSKMLYHWKAKLVFRNANKMSSFIRSSSQRLLNQVLISKVDHVISVSRNCQADITALFPIVSSNIETIPIGTFLFTEAPVARITAGPVLIGIGSFVPEKNMLFLIDVFALVKKRYPSAQLWLVGDGKLKEAMVEKVTSLGLTTDVTFWGVQKTVIPILKAADVMVMPSLIEGLPGVILEALSCGIPVVASNVGGIPEVVIDQITGRCLSQWNESDYVAAIEEIWLDQRTRLRFIERGKALVQNEYLMSDISTRFRHSYEQLLSRK